MKNNSKNLGLVTKKFNDFFLVDLKIQLIQVNWTYQYHYIQEQLFFALLGQFHNFYGSENFEFLIYLKKFYLCIH